MVIQKIIDFKQDKSLNTENNNEQIQNLNNINNIFNDNNFNYGTK